MAETGAQRQQVHEEGITCVVTNINALASTLPAAVRSCLAGFSRADRTVTVARK